MNGPHIKTTLRKHRESSCAFTGDRHPAVALTIEARENDVDVPNVSYVAADLAEEWLDVPTCSM
jgi:hypothetical protein